MEQLGVSVLASRQPIIDPVLEEKGNFTQKIKNDSSASDDSDVNEGFMVNYCIHRMQIFVINLSDWA